MGKKIMTEHNVLVLFNCVITSRVVCYFGPVEPINCIQLEVFIGTEISWDPTKRRGSRCFLLA